jgi:hypothetical protein
MNSDGEMIKTKVVYHDETYNFVVDNLFYKIGFVIVLYMIIV